MTAPIGTNDRFGFAYADPNDLNYETVNRALGELAYGVGTIIVNDGVTPPDSELFDGAIVKERTSGKIWVAQRNAANGTFEKSYIRWPWIAHAYGGNAAFGNGGYNAIAMQADGANLNQGGIAGGRVPLPVDGFYSGTIQARFGSGFPVGGRGIGLDCLRAGAPVPLNDSRVEAAAKPSGQTQVQATFRDRFSKNDGLTVQVLVEGMPNGALIPVDVNIHMTLDFPL